LSAVWPQRLNAETRIANEETTAIFFNFGSRF